MKIIISDASTLILLQKTFLLNELIKKLKFVIPEEVYNEAILNGKKKKFADSYHLDEKVNKKDIIIKKVKDIERLKYLRKEFKIGEGELQAISLFLEEKADILASDDHKAINICKIYQIPFMTALTFTIFAFKNKLINKKEAEELVKKLTIYGRYKDELIYKTYKIIKGE